MLKKIKLIDIKTNLSNCLFLNKHTFYVFENKTLKKYNIDKMTSENILELKEGHPNLLKFDDSFLWYSNKRLLRKFQIRTGKEDTFDYGKFNTLNQNLGIFYTKENNNIFFNVYDLNIKKILWKHKAIISPKFLNNYFFSENSTNNKLSLHRNETGEVIWQLDVSKVFHDLKLSKFIGAYKNVLLVGIGTTTDVNNYIAAISIDTGEVIWKQKGFYNFLKINPSDGCIYLINAGYSKTDIPTGNILDEYVNNEVFGLDKFLSYRDNYVILKDHIISTDHKLGKIVAFNTKTHQFDWVHKEPGVNFPIGSPIIYKAPYLFVQDNKKTVHVFEHTNPNVL
ncbi:PQQ-binding-like beta-propeller repeat protein [Pseudotamlana agarivorans]|uniref:hypothetical protein n=1 Tax=Pseudotamlana agarivorans TaxID=481183 RepID=UPI000829BC69|nr:hypothetical protein [Tamlana agarivorans]